MQVIYRSKVLRVVLLFSFLIPLSACAATPATLASDPYQGTITVSGAFALYPMMQRWGEEFHNLHPGVQFDISAGGAGKGMTDVLSGAVDIGMISRDITSNEMTKGLYAKARCGELKDFTGVDDPYEPPIEPELTLHTVDISPEANARTIIEYLRGQGYLEHGEESDLK